MNDDFDDLDPDLDHTPDQNEEENGELPAAAAKCRAAVEKFLAATGHDLCHENRSELAHAFGIKLIGNWPCLPTEQEFAERCIAYRQECYGPGGPGSDQEVYEKRIAALENRLAEAGMIVRILRALYGNEPWCKRLCKFVLGEAQPGRQDEGGDDSHLKGTVAG